MSVSIAIGQTSFVRANQPIGFTVTVTNGDGTAATLTSLAISEDTDVGANIAQPVWQNQGQPAGVLSQPVINASSSASYGFSVVVPSPSTPGPNPNNAPGDAAGHGNAQPPPNSQLTLRATGQTSAGLFSSILTVPVLSAVAPTPRPDVGALFFAQGGNSSLAASLP